MIFRRLIWLGALVTISLYAFPQKISDSLPTPVDSLQDLRIDRFERWVGSQMEEIRRRSLESDQVRDSLDMVIEELKQEAVQLEQQNRQLATQISSIREDNERSAMESIRYREKLERTLWLAGAIGIVLVVASFIYLLLYSLRTRWMLERLRVRLNKLRRNLRVQRKKLRKAPAIQKKAIRRITRSEVQNRVKAKHLKKN